MLSICLIVLFSVVLFIYWFRYSCLLILQNRTAYSFEYTNGSALSFPAVQERLRSGDADVELLNQLHDELSNDYRIICFLLRCAAENGVDPIERRLLMLDYWIMKTWFGAARQVSPLQARKALEEMSNIVSYFAYSVGRNAAPQSPA